MSLLLPIPIYGLYYYYQQRVVSLPLLGVRAEASIKELAAQVKLTQTYGNDATFPIEAKYSFPIPARASVCSFVMIKQDGTRVVGKVQEKQEARETYNTAVSQGQQASLMEQQTPDVFQVSVGNIPSNEQVQIELVYATELSEDEENDSIRFHLPVHIGARYGQAPQSTPPVSSAFRGSLFVSSSSPTPFLTIAMSVEAIAPISKIGCPSHTVSTELGPDPKLPNFKELPFSNYARVSLSSDSPLDKDFVLTIKSAGLDAPRCVAEMHPIHDTVAMGLTLVPRFKLPELNRQEFVFMVDRSGSMSNQRIEAAKKALVIMLRALPHQESLFQIVSFGSRTSSLWAQGSKPYNQETLEEATRHIDSMRADYGGTEIRAALQHCFKARKLDRPMSLLVLTDGDAWDIDGVLSEVKSAVAAAPKNAFLRVSVLGIGNSVSTAMCEGMARVGNGTCMLVGEQETTFTGKIARMLKAAKTPPISDISVDWGRKEKAVSVLDDSDEFEMVEKTEKKQKKTLNIFDEDIDDPMEVDSKPAPPPPQVVLPPPPPVQQAPYKIRNLFPNIRLNVYAILEGKTIPRTITIRGSTVDGAEIELPIPVALSHLQNAPDSPPAIHALAARKIVQDLEDGQHALAKTLANPDDTDLLARTVKASIVRLGKTYSIVSSHTSFVAVDESKPEAPPLPQVYMVATAAPVVQPLFGASVVNPYQSTSAFGGSSYAAPAAYSTLAAHAAPTPSYGLQSASAFSGFSYAPPAPSFNGAPAVPSSQLFGGGGMGGTGFGSAPPPSNDMARGKASAKKRHHITAEYNPGATAGQSAPSHSSHLMSFGGAAPAAFAPPQQQFQQQTAAFGQPHIQTIQPPAQQSALFGAHSMPQAAFSATPFSAGRDSRDRDRERQRSPPPSDPLEALARLQAFDGCFSLDVLRVVKLKSDIQAVRNAFPAGATDAIVATILAMAFLSTKLGAGVDRDSWEGIYEKAQQYVEAALRNIGAAETADVLEAKVAQLLA
ncbi:von Willebrand factor type A domain-containing protein [Mycena capillaripes]|nr:von Willebrand factor type A domain-containing protein [Mycena capillaripes]